mgnify:CR=1 FL=1
MASAPRNIVILISGGGSNMAAIVQTAQRDHWQQRYGTRVAAVISNRADAGGLAFARDHGVDTAVIDHTEYADRSAFDERLSQEIDRHQPALVGLDSCAFSRQDSLRVRRDGCSTSILRCCRHSQGCIHTSGPLTPAAVLPAPRCTRSRPNWITDRSWRKPWCRSCQTIPPTAWPRAC